MIERTTIRLPKVLLDLARKKAADEGRTLTSLIEEGVYLALDKREDDRKMAGGYKMPRTFPRSSSVIGGEQPGIDLTRMADIYEMEDLEYVERMRKGIK